MLDPGNYFDEGYVSALTNILSYENVPVDKPKVLFMD